MGPSSGSRQKIHRRHRDTRGGGSSANRIVNPTVHRRICVTPVRNEGWIIDRFLAAAMTWATDVVVADQGSTDETQPTLRKTAGVHLVINDSPAYDENHRQRLLLDRARQIPGNRILIGLDADEALSANITSSDNWRRLDTAQPGTVVRFRWVNVLPGFTHAWIPSALVPFGFVDDGSPHNGRRIHSPRVPQPDGAPIVDIQDVVVLHFQFVAWDRMVSKHRWYQAWEHVTHRLKSALEIFREYHHMYGSWDESEIHPIDPKWFDEYKRRGIDFQALRSEPITWWDSEVLAMLEQHGPDQFRKIDIWDKDWNSVAEQLGRPKRDLSDPRSPFEKAAHRMLRATQKNRSHFTVRTLERILRTTGW
jgi:hypothetical protein